MRRGYHAFVLRYSTYMEGKSGFPILAKEIPVKKHCQHPAPVREIGKAMLLIRNNAGQWQVDVEKIVVCGFSAGAHNTAMYATHWHRELMSECFQTKNELFRPAAIILGYTLSDYVYMRDHVLEDQEKVLFQVSNTAFLGEQEPSEERLMAVSPCMHVTKETPPVFLWGTAADSMVPIQHTLRMAHALADNKIPFEMHVFEEGMHGLSTAKKASAMAKNQINADAEKWMELVEKWLAKRLVTNLPEKLLF